MPKLHSKTMRLRRQAVTAAAKSCFLRRGFNGVSMRDIAAEAGCSLGKLYVHFPDKLSLYRCVVREESKQFLDLSNPLAVHLFSSTFPDDLTALAAAAREVVERHDDYYRLAYVDAVDFGGRHVRDVFSNLEERFRKSGKLDGALPKGSDRSFAFTAVYLSFLHFYMLSRQFGATNVYRARDEHEAIEKLVRLFREGVGP